MNGTLEKDPEKRWTIEQIKKSDYYKGERATKKEIQQEFSDRLKGMRPDDEKDRK